MSRMRGYQAMMQAGTYQAWAEGCQVVMPVVATGGGKTVVMADTARKHVGHGLAAAHRGVLVGQISQSLAREGVVHNVVGPSSLIKSVVDAHMEEFGKCFFNASARFHVASVDTLRRRNVGNLKELITLGMMDEGHHILRKNKWGECVQMFPNAKWMTPTASPKRADGCGLGRHAFCIRGGR